MNFLEAMANEVRKKLANQQPVNRPNPAIEARLGAQAPVMKQAPSYGSGLTGVVNKTRDVFDANTAQDRFKRQQVGQPVFVTPIQKQAPQIVKQMAVSTAKPFQQFGNAVVEANRAAYVDLPKAITAQATGNKQAMANIVNDMDRRLKGKGTFGAGMPDGFQSFNQSTKSFTEDPSKIRSSVGTGAQIASTVIPVGKGLSVANQGFKAVPKLAGQSAGVSAVGSAGYQYAETGKVDPKQLLLDTALGTGLGVAPPVMYAGAKKAAPFVNDMATNATRNPAMLGGGSATGFNKAKAAGQVFDGKDGKPRFEFDDSKAKIASRDGKTLGSVLGHPELYKQYPQLKDIPVVMDSKMGAGTNGAFDGKVLRLSPEKLLGSDESLKSTILHEAQHAVQRTEKFARGGSDREFGLKLQQLNKSRMAELDDINAQLRAEASKKPDTGVYTPPSDEYNRLLGQRNDLIRLLNETQDQYGSVQGKAIEQYRKLAGEAEARAVSARMNMTPDQRTKTPFYDSLDVPENELIVRSGDGKAMSIDPPAQVGKTVEQPKTPNPVVQDYADMLKSIDDNAKGGQLVDTTGYRDPYGSGMTRVTEHSKFYSDFYATNKRKPSKADWLAEAERQLKSGQADPEFLKAYADTSNPEISSLLQEADKGTLAKQPVGETFELPKRTGVEPPKTPTTPPPTVPVGPNGKTRGFVKSVKNSPEVSPEAQKLTKGKYEVSSQETLQDNADRLARNLKQARAQVSEELSAPNGKITDQHVANAIAVAKKLDGKGNYDGASEIYNRLAEHGTAAGQEISAFKLLSNRTPEGVRFGAERSLKKAGVTLTVEDKKQLQALTNELRSTPKGTSEYDMALHNITQFVNNKLPMSMGNKLVNLWRAGLLTSPVTTAGNIVGNTTEAVTKQIWTNPVATGADIIQSWITGKRTKTLSGGYTKGGAKGVGKAGTYLKTGFDERNPITKFDGKGEINYGNNPVGRGVGNYVNGVYRWMGGQDQPFYYAAKGNATRDLAKADAINLKLKGSERSAYIKSAVDNPDWKPQTFDTKSNATEAGKYAVYQNETALGKAAQLAKQPFKVGDKTFDGGIRNFIMPFTQVPSAVATRIIDRTPIGIAKELVSQIRNKKYDQRAMSEAIGNGTFGVGVLAAGVALAKSDLIAGAYPTDQKEAELWKLQGKQANSVKIGNRWYSLNYMQPFGTLLSIGAQYHKDIKEGKSQQEAWLNAGGTAAKSIESQSFLQGLNGILSAVNDPERSLNKYVTTTASSAVPNLVRTATRAFDDVQRDPKGLVQGLMSAVPGLRDNLPVKQDAFGQPLARPDNPANTLLNPLRPSKVKNAGDTVVTEMQRLQDTKNGIIPTQFNATSISGVKLTPDQVRDLQSQAGPQIDKAWQQIISNPQYANLSDADKATALKKAQDDINAVVKQQFAATNNLGQYSADFTGKPTNLNSKQQTIATGGVDYNSYLYGKADTPEAKYQQSLAKYQQGIKDGTLTGSDRIKAEQTLARQQVQSKYTQEVIDFYNLSKAGRDEYFRRDRAKATELYDQAKKMDGELGTKKLASTARKTSSSSRSTGRKATTKKTAKTRTKKASTASFVLPGTITRKLSLQGSELARKASLKNTAKLTGIKKLA